MNEYPVNDGVTPNNILYTEFFLRPRLNPYGFYLVILVLGIRWAIMKYHIKPLDDKNTRF